MLALPTLGLFFPAEISQTHTLHTLSQWVSGNVVHRAFLHGKNKNHCARCAQGAASHADPRCGVRNFFFGAGTRLRFEVHYGTVKTRVRTDSQMRV